MSARTTWLAETAILFTLAITVGVSIAMVVPPPRGPAAPCTAVGKDRWTVKTSAPLPWAARTMTLTAIVALPAPVQVRSGGKGAKAIHQRYQPLDGGIGEGQPVTVDGYLRDVALSADDCDWHVALTPTLGDSGMVIVEIPQPDARHVADSALRGYLLSARDSLRAILGNSFTVRTPMRVTMTGALFFDGTHYPDCASRGHGIKAATCWELHPVTAVSRGTIVLAREFRVSR